MRPVEEAEPILTELGRRFAALFDLYHRAGHRLYLVGGCVRDTLLGQTARTDYDFATDALPEDSLRILDEAGLRTFPIGARFGTIAALVQGTMVEITTFRVREQYAEGNRKPEVEFGHSLEDDLSRRDLSINAMAIDRHGHLIDPFDGRHALEQAVLEVPRGGYENTCSILRDDPLRLLRIARFTGRLGFRPTDDTTRAATDSARDLLSISRERWKMEMDKLLCTAHVGQGLGWLARTGALAVILPDAAALVALGQVDRAGVQIADAPPDVRTRWAVLVLHALVCAHSGARLDLRDTASPWPAAPLRQQRAREVADRFRFSVSERLSLVRMVGTTLREADFDTPWSRPRLRRYALAHGEDALRTLDLVETIADTSPGLAERIDGVRLGYAALMRDEDPHPRLPRGLGHVLVERLGLERGPVLASITRRLQDAILDEELTNDPDIDACLAWLHQQDPKTLEG